MDKCYKADEAALNWTAHQDKAIEEGCQLASISNASEALDVVAAATANMLMGNNSLYKDVLSLAWVGLERPANPASQKDWGEW